MAPLIIRRTSPEAPTWKQDLAGIRELQHLDKGVEGAARIYSCFRDVVRNHQMWLASLVASATVGAVCGAAARAASSFLLATKQEQEQPLLLQQPAGKCALAGGLVTQAILSYGIAQYLPSQLMKKHWTHGLGMLENEAFCSNPEVLILVASEKDDSVPVAMLIIEPCKYSSAFSLANFKWDPDADFELTRVFVRQEYRGQNIFAKMVVTALDFVQSVIFGRLSSTSAAAAADNTGNGDKQTQAKKNRVVAVSSMAANYEGLIHVLEKKFGFSWVANGYKGVPFCSWMKGYLFEKTM